MLLHSHDSRQPDDEDEEDDLAPGCGFIALIAILIALGLFTWVLVALF